MSHPQMRSPALRWNAEDRAEGIRNNTHPTIFNPELEVNFVARYVARRHGLAVPQARAAVTLASLGRVLV